MWGRIGRSVFLACASLSLLLALGIVYLWATSYPQRYGLMHEEAIGTATVNEDRLIQFGIERGSFEYASTVFGPWYSPDSGGPAYRNAWVFDAKVPALHLSHCVGGFLARTIPPDEQTPGTWRRYVVVPLWLPLLLLLVAPIRALPLWREWWIHWRSARLHRRRGFEPVAASSQAPPVSAALTPLRCRK